MRLPSISAPVAVAISLSVVSIFLSLGGAGLAANGGAFVLGVVNAATARTFLGANFAGPTLQLSNTQGGLATALSLSVASGQPPLKVNSSGKVVNLNADYVDGMNSTQIARVQRVPFTLNAGASLSITLPTGVPVHVAGGQINGDGGVGQGTLMSRNGLLRWVDADSSSEPSPQSNGANTIGEHIFYVDLAGTLDLQSNGGAAVRVHNGSDSVSTGFVTLTW